MIGYFVGHHPMIIFLLTVVRSRKNCTRLLSKELAARVVCTWRGGGIYPLLWMTGWLICTTALSFWVKLLALQFSHIRMCTAQQETWTDLHHWCVAETLLAVTLCLWLTFLGTVVFRFWKLYQFKLIETLRESVCLCLVCVLDKLIILSKFLTPKERIHYTYTTAK